MAQKLGSQAVGVNISPFQVRSGCVLGSLTASWMESWSWLMLQT